MLAGLKSFITQCRRILAISTRPNRDEYMSYAKIIAIGLLLLGVFGFVLYAIFYFMPL